MKIEVFSQPKSRTMQKPGDDVILIVPDLVYAIFDGATDPTGTRYDGESSGHFAARIAAQTLSAIVAEADIRRHSGEEIRNRISSAIGDQVSGMQPSHPSTTMAAVLDCGSHYRFLIVGDTGIRINGEMLHLHHKLVDDISAAARIAIFRSLSGRGLEADAVEKRARQIIYGGVEAAMRDGALTHGEAEAAVTAAEAAVSSPDQVAAARGFALGGIRTQKHFANREDHPFGYATLDGQRVIGEGISDFELPKEAIASIEIFSDGYASLPAETSVQAWETAFTLSEETDFHKIGAYPGVKGSLSDEFGDDRSLISLRLE